MTYRLFLMGIFVAGLLAVGCGGKDGGTIHPKVTGSLPEGKEVKPVMPSSGGAPNQPGKVTGASD